MIDSKDVAAEGVRSMHTPGPWRAQYRTHPIDGVAVSFCVYGGLGAICSGQSQEHVGEGNGVMEVECRANARLIAAAPLLLIALEDAMEFIEGFVDVVDGPDGEPQANKAMILMGSLEAAIAKATAL